jgi:hypothetical protein
LVNWKYKRNKQPYTNSYMYSVTSKVGWYTCESFLNRVSRNNSPKGCIAYMGKGTNDSWPCLCMRQQELEWAGKQHLSNIHMSTT